jgi:xylan 1,4-beta-xylosidase
MLYDSIIACFGGRLTVNLMPQARRYRVFPLGTFHYFDWQKTDTVGISIGTCPQIVSSEQAQIGVTVGGQTRILPFGEGETFAQMRQRITPLTTTLTAHDPELPVSLNVTFRCAFYPQSFDHSAVPAYCVEITATNLTGAPQNAEVFFGLPLPNVTITGDSLHSQMPLVFPAGIDHDGIDDLIFEQVLIGDGAAVSDDALPRLNAMLALSPGAEQTVRFYHAGYIAQPTLNQRGRLLRFGYTTLWPDARTAAQWFQQHYADIKRRGDRFEETILEASVPPELKTILASAFKGLICNAWWAEDGWFSIMEIGAYHSTLDVDYQLALFFFQYWPGLVKRMLDQWAAYYEPGSGYMAHDVGQHLSATGNRYGGPGSAMKVEENCNYLTLLHHYWRATGDAGVLDGKGDLIAELLAFLLAADTSGSGLPNRYTDNTNDWGSGLITASEEQSYHGVRLIAAYSAAIQMAEQFEDAAWSHACADAIERINRTMASGWLGDHYPISFSDPASYHHYSMWTIHGLLYALRGDMRLPIDMGRLRTDLISSTQRTMREHGCVHSTVDVRGWLTQNLWRDCIAAYLGVDLTNNLRRYLGHGEYVSYEDTTILEVANELMVVPGAAIGHSYVGQTHDFPMVDGHPRPACGFGLLYALAGVQYDTVERRLRLHPVSFPLRIALTHLADWQNGVVPWLIVTRSIPNQDSGPQPPVIQYSIENEHLLAGWDVGLKS